MIKLRIFCFVITFCALFMATSMIAPRSARLVFGYYSVKVEPHFNDIFGAVFYQALSQKRTEYKRDN